MTFCDRCGKELQDHEICEFDGKELCEDCLNSHTAVCIHCDERIWEEHNAGTISIPLCQHCYDAHYTSCEHCGTLLSYDDACYLDDNEDYPYCQSCYEEKFSKTMIKNYHFKPDPHFYGDDIRYFGVELEIDEGGENPCHAEEILQVANAGGKEYLYCKHDGSLDDGFEMVTHPMTLDFHMNSMPWEQILDRAIRMKYRSHQTSTCGLHIHVSRYAFGDTEREQDECIARILYFFEKHWDELLKFSRRTRSQLNRWAARYGYQEDPKEILSAAKDDSATRYACVNLMNSETIEFRIFRGTLKLNTLLATLQMVNQICDVALFYSDEEVKRLSWTDFMSRIEEPELIQYLKERRLYINDVVGGEEDL